MARRDSIALYTSPKGLLWRRLSEPSPTKTINEREVFASNSGISPKAFRRYSFSALEDYRKGKNTDRNIGTLLDRDNLTPLQIRNQVDGILQKNGFKEIEQAKASQLRRYSLNSDKDVMPLLGDGIRRDSFGAGVRTTATTRTARVDKQDRKNLEHETSKVKPVAAPDHGPVTYVPEINALSNSVRTNAWAISKTPAYLQRSELRKTLEDDDVEIIKLPETGNIDDHLQLKRSLWKGRCRRDSLSKFRNHVVDGLRSYVETDTEYWRRCRSMSIDDGSSSVPKCKYQLRQSGLIASELANSTRIDIDTSINKLEEYDCHDAWRNSSTDQPLSDAAATPDKAEVLHNLLKRRRKSSLFSEYDFDRKTFFQRSLSSFSDRNSQLDSPDLSVSQPFSFQRSLSRQDSKSESVLGSEACLAQQRGNWRRPSIEKRRWSLTPSDGFELIGTSALHGTPGYKGRLMLLTARTVRFHEDFNSDT